MDDVAMGSVGQRVGDLAKNPTYFDRRHWTVLLQPLPQVVALDVRHDEVNEIVALFDGVDRNDVGVIQLRSRLRFAEEPLANIGPEAQFGRQYLDRNFPLQPLVARAVNDPHAATPDLVL